MEVELSALGATNPSLWMSLFDVSQAIYDSKPLPKISEWKPAFNSVQDLYRMSLKDPREFAVAQTLMTIMHQQQMKEEIIGQLTKTEPKTQTGAASTTDEGSVSRELYEMRKEMDLLSYRINEQLKSNGLLKERVDSLQQSMKSIKTPVTKARIVQESVPTMLFSRSNQKWWEEYLMKNCSSLYPEPDKLLDLYDCPKTVDKASLYAKAKEHADPGVPPAVVFLISVMAKGNFASMKFEKTSNLQRFASVCQIQYYNLIPADHCVELVIQHSLRSSRLYTEKKSDLL